MSMSFVRIPVSLRIERDDDEFFDFVMGLKNSKELSSLVINLLKGYQKDSRFQELLDEFLIESDDYYRKVVEQFDKVQLANQRIGNTTSMLRDEIRTVQTKTSPQSEMGLEVSERLDMLERHLPEINEKLDMFLKQVEQKQYPGLLPVRASEPVDTFEEEDIIEHVPVIEDVKPEPVPVVVEKVEAIEPEINPSVGNDLLGGISPLLLIDDDDEEEDGESSELQDDSPKKPSSFGKAFSSTQKK